MHEAEGILYLPSVRYSRLDAFSSSNYDSGLFSNLFQASCCFIHCVRVMQQVDLLGMCSLLTKANTTKIIHIISGVIALCLGNAKMLDLGACRRHDCLAQSGAGFFINLL